MPDAMLLAINFHYIRPEFGDPYPGVHGVTPEQLVTQLRMLGTVARFISPNEVVASLQEASPPTRPRLLVTFDDGLREQFEVALPALQKLGVPAIFFVNTAPILERTVSLVHKIHLLRARTAPEELGCRLERHAARLAIALPPVEVDAARLQYPYDTPEHAELKYRLGFGIPPRQREQLLNKVFEERFPGQEADIADELYMEPGHLRALSELNALGTHGHQHVALGRVASGEAESQLRVSIETLETLTGKRPDALSYPYGGDGSTSPAVAGHAKRLGIRYAFTMERTGNVAPCDPLHLGRFDCNDLPGGKSPLCDIGNLQRLMTVPQPHDREAFR